MLLLWWVLYKDVNRKIVGLVLFLSFCLMLFVAALEVAYSHDWCILTVDDLLHLHTLIRSHAHTHTYTHTHKHTYTHKHTHTQAHTSTQAHTHKFINCLNLPNVLLLIFFRCLTILKHLNAKFVLVFGISNWYFLIYKLFILLFDWFEWQSQIVLYYCQIFELFSIIIELCVIHCIK